MQLQHETKPWWHLSLTKQILFGLVFGIFLGWIAPEFSSSLKFMRDIFLNLIKSIIAPLVFSTIVIGIAGGGDLKKVGRMGAKSILYFEIVTTIALFLGLAVVNIVQPGLGIVLNGDPGTLGTIAQNHPKTLIETIVHVFPSSIIDAMAKGDVLQIVAFSIVFAMALTAIGEKGKPIIDMCDSLAQIMFKFTGFIMKFAPFGVGAAMAVTISHQGLGVLTNLGMLIISLYIALILFVVCILFVFVFVVVCLFLCLSVLFSFLVVSEPLSIRKIAWRRRRLQ